MPGFGRFVGISGFNFSVTYQARHLALFTLVESKACPIPFLVCFGRLCCKLCIPYLEPSTRTLVSYVLLTYSGSRYYCGTQKARVPMTMV